MRPSRSSGAGARLVLGGMAFLAAAAAASAQELTYAGSLQFATGDYLFPERMSSLYLATGLALVSGRLRATVTVPVIVQDAGWVQYGGSGPVPTGGMPGHDAADDRATGGPGGIPGGMHGGRITPRSGTEGSHAGIGDPLARLEISMLRGARGLRGLQALSVVAAAKAPLAEASSGFGTGRWDYGAGLAVASEISGTFLFADATYWVLGDTPALRFRDPVAYGVSVGRLTRSGRVGVLASLTGTTSALAGVTGPVLVGGGVSYRWPSGRGVSSSVAFGVTDSAPAVSLGAGWQIPLR